MHTATISAAAILLALVIAIPSGQAQTNTSPRVTAQKASPSTWDKISGNWMVAKGKVKEQWGKLTDDDISVIEGRRDVLVGRLQERYGYSKKAAEQRVSRWERGYRG